jgi:glucose-6-phosphate 1-dehydrogenase
MSLDTLEPVPENPLAEGLERLPVHPASLVIFGATGDLARRKLLPAIYNLAHEGMLPERFHLVGVSRAAMSEEGFRQEAAEAVRAYSRRPPNPAVLGELLKSTTYVNGSFDDADLYEELQLVLGTLDRDGPVHLNRHFYLSTAPEFFAVIVRLLGEHGLSRHEGAEVRVVIEKPFGASLEEARALNRVVLSIFEEHQVFRIDHYLGKETVQNLLALRFANYLFEPVWNRNYIEHVQITAAEDIGIGGRAGYYEATGALRDLVQNHMLQLLGLLAMEPPVGFSADDVRNEKVKALHAIGAPEDEAVEQIAVRGQYGPGVIAGEPVPGYLQEHGVREGSTTETFAALRLEVDSWRWAGVPFYVRTGKRLARRVTEIAVTLKPVPFLPFARDGASGVRPNTLVLAIQPDEGVSVSLNAKIPGVRMLLRPVQMQFLYGASFVSQSPEAYERLLLDAMRGDATLFTRADEVEEQWRICDPIVRAWQRTPGPVPQYPAGSQGPEEADSILLPGHTWRTI